MDASFVPKSGKHTYGLDRFWNGSHSRAEKGLEISTLAWLDITDNCADRRVLSRAPPSAQTADPETTRMDVSLDQLSRVVTTHDLRFLRYVVTDGAYSKQKFVAGVRALDTDQIGKLRADAHLRYLYQVPNAQVQAAKRPMMARSTGVTYRALSASIPKTSTSFCTIKCSTMCS